MEVGVDAGGRCHTLEPPEGTTGPLPATETTPTLPRQTPSHTAPVSADQSRQPREACLRPLRGQGSHVELGGAPEPRLPSAQSDGGPTPGRCS